MHPASSNLATLLWRSAAAQPHQPALLRREGETSYGALVRRAAAVAGALRSAGAVPGDRAAFLLERSGDAIAALFGIHAAGLIAVGINDRLRPRQIEHQLNHSGARVLLSDATMLGRLPRALATEAEILDVSAVPPEGSGEPLQRQPADLAQIIYTSGSTGLPKGVVFTHGALQAGIATVNAYLGQRADDRVASLLALSTVYGLNQVLTAVACGASVVVETSPLAAEALVTLRERGATVIAAVPPLWLQFLAVNGFDAGSLPAARVLQNAGGHLPVDAVRRIRSAFPRADFFLQHLTQCLAAAPDRREKDNHIVHASAQRCADQDPERTRQKSKLRCQHRPHQRPRTSDRCKMMPENHPTIRWHIILAIVLQDRRRGSFVIEHQYFCSEPFAVKTVADAKRAKARHNDPKGTDLLAALRWRARRGPKA